MRTPLRGGTSIELEGLASKNWSDAYDVLGTGIGLEYIESPGFP